MKWNEKFPFAPLLLKIDISELKILHNKLLYNKRLFSLQPLSHYFNVFENMCHQSGDCGQIEVTNSHKNEFKLKVVWALLIENCL